MNDKTLIYQKKMEILLGLRGFSIIKINEMQALWKINSKYSIIIDVTFPSKLWEVKHQGNKVDNWKNDACLPVSIRGMIQSLEDDFVKACAEAGIIIYPEGNDYVSPERLEELRKELAEALSEPDPEEAEPTKTEGCKPPEETQSAEPTPEPLDESKNITDRLIKILGVLIETPTNPGITRKHIKTEEVTA